LSAREDEVVEPTYEDLRIINVVVPVAKPVPASDDKK
jgi:hypothetical protein